MFGFVDIGFSFVENKPSMKLLRDRRLIPSGQWLPLERSFPPLFSPRGGYIYCITLNYVAIITLLRVIENWRLAICWSIHVCVCPYPYCRCPPLVICHFVSVRYAYTFSVVDLHTWGHTRKYGPDQAVKCLTSAAMHRNTPDAAACVTTFTTTPQGEFGAV